MENEEKETSRTDVDWENRKLCADESCIGVIGYDGRCKECGRPDNPDAFVKETVEPSVDAKADLELPEKETTFEPQKADDEMDWKSRRLCVDEACIGVIGSDGRCKECGKSEEAT